MIYTSYYGNRTIPDEAFKVQISSSKPEGYKVDLVWKSVAPDYDTLVSPIKSGRITEKAYTNLYLRQLSKTKAIGNFFEILRRAGKRDVFLLCYCRKDAFCHRHILADWLNEKTHREIVEYDSGQPEVKELSLF